MCTIFHTRVVVFVCAVCVCVHIFQSKLFIILSFWKFKKIITHFNNPLDWTGYFKIVTTFFFSNHRIFIPYALIVVGLRFSYCANKLFWKNLCTHFNDFDEISLKFKDNLAKTICSAFDIYIVYHLYFTQHWIEQWLLMKNTRSIVDLLIKMQYGLQVACYKFLLYTGQLTRCQESVVMCGIHFVTASVFEYSIFSSIIFTEFKLGWRMEWVVRLHRVSFIVLTSSSCSTAKSL